MSYTSFTITQPFLGAPLQFTPALGSVEFELLVDCYVSGSAPKQDKLSQVTIDFYTTATVDLTNGALVKTYSVFPAWMAQGPTQSQSSGFTPSPASSANLQANLGDSAHGSTRPGTASGRISKKAKKDTSTRKTAEARLPGFSIMTKDGIDVTRSAGRGIKTNEQREHAHLMRQLKACADCKRKKIRCDPSHRRSHNEMSRTSTSNASSASDRISPAASAPFDSTNAFADLAFFSDDSTLFPDDAAFFQDGMAMWDSVAPSVKEYMSENLGNFNFDIANHQDSLKLVNRSSQDTSHDVPFDQGHAPMWDADNDQFQDIPGDWVLSSMPRLDVPDNIPQNINVDAHVLADMPRLSVVHYAQLAPVGAMPGEQVLDGHTVNNSLRIVTAVLSSAVLTPAVHVRNVPGALKQQASVRPDSLPNVDADAALHIESEVQPTRKMLVSHLRAQTEQQEGDSALVVQQLGRDGGSLGRLQSTVQTQVGSQQPVVLGRCLDSLPMQQASAATPDANANYVAAPNVSVLVQEAASSTIVEVLIVIVVSVFASLLLSGSGIMAWIRDACLQAAGLDDLWKIQVAGLGALAVVGLFPEVWGLFCGNSVFGSGVGLRLLYSAALGLVSGSGFTSSVGSDGWKLITTSSVSADARMNANSSPLKSQGLRAGYDSAPSSKMLLDLLPQLTLAIVGLV